MKSTGIRILDKKDRLVTVELPDILKEIPNGESFKWSILYLEASGDLGEGKSILDLEKEANKSQNGLLIEWDAINTLAPKFFQIIDMILIGCKNENFLRRYETDQEMYETCDIVINMFDSSYWEIFSKDEQLINRLASKFKDVKFLESDFQKDYQ
jgi:hypothetical protein